MSPMKDRLSEMRQIQNGGTSLHAAPETAKTDSDKITRTFKKAETIREQIDVITDNTAKANNILKNNVFKITKDLQDQLDVLFKTSTSTAYKINNSLKEFENDLNKIEDENSTEFRIRNVQYTALKREFQEALRDSSTCLELHKNKRRELLKKSLKTTCTDVSEEELEHLLNEEKLDIFTDNVLITTEEAKQQLSDIQERHKELLKIEKQLNEVLDIFIKIATLVEQQQESVDRVEFHAIAATDLIEQGTTDLEKTVRSRKRHRKRKIYIILVSIIVILCVFLVLVIV